MCVASDTFLGVQSPRAPGSGGKSAPTGHVTTVVEAISWCTPSSPISQVANLRIVHELFLVLYGSAPTPRYMAVMEDTTHYTPFTLEHSDHSFHFKLKTLLRISYLVKYLSVLSVDRPGSPYLLCDLAPERFRFSPDFVPKMVALPVTPSSAPSGPWLAHILGSIVEFIRRPPLKVSAPLGPGVWSGAAELLKVRPKNRLRT